jgi:hypothetical protein
MEGSAFRKVRARGPPAWIGRISRGCLTSSRLLGVTDVVAGGVWLGGVVAGGVALEGVVAGGA